MKIRNIAIGAVVGGVIFSGGITAVGILEKASQ